jgi:hypothetical protein
MWTTISQVVLPPLAFRIVYSLKKQAVTSADIGFVGGAA